MIVTIHQPEHIVWLGLLDKISRADIFVVLDTVQFRKNYFQNRNKIRTQNGSDWLSIPLTKFSLNTLIKDMKISYNQDWTVKYFGKIQECYRKSRYIDKYFPAIQNIFRKKHMSLSLLNIELIEQFMEWFDIRTRMVVASSLEIERVVGGTEVTLQICKHLNADAYLSGPSGKDYLDLKPYQGANISVLFHKFRHPEYSQLYEPFIPYMSALDLLFNHGDEAKNILFGEQS